MNKFLLGILKWIVGTPIMMLGGLMITVLGVVLILWGIAVILIAPIISPFADVQLHIDED